MKKVITVCFCLFFALVFLLWLVESETGENRARIELTQIEQKIEVLGQLRRRYQASYDSNIDEATRWQFEDNERLEARQEYAEADVNKKTLETIDQEIKVLQEKKTQILKKYPELSAQESKKE